MLAGQGLAPPVHLRDQVAVGGPGGFELVAAFGQLAAQFGVVLLQAGDLLLCDTRSHEVSEHVEEVWLCRRRSYGLVFETVPAVTCVVSNDRVRSSRKNPRAPVPTGCHRCGEGWAWGDYQGILADASSDLLPGSGWRTGLKGAGRCEAAGDGRGSSHGRVDTAAPGVQRTPVPSRVSRVRNVENRAPRGAS